MKRLLLLSIMLIFLSIAYSAVIGYPEGIDIEDFAYSLYEEYPEEFKDVYYSFPGPGLIAIEGNYNEEILKNEIREKNVYPFSVVPEYMNTAGDGEFDFIVVFTSDINGNFKEKENGAGISRVKSLVSMIRGITDNVLVLDAGGSLTGGSVAAGILSDAGYDAVNVSSAEVDNDFPFVISTNVTDEEGYFLLNPYALFQYNGWTVCVLSITDNPSYMGDIVMDNAQYALDAAHEYADFVILLAHLEGGITSEDILSYLSGIDLLISSDFNEEGLGSIGAALVSVENGKAEVVETYLIEASEITEASSSDLFTSLGVNLIAPDPDMDEYIESMYESSVFIPMDMNAEGVLESRTNFSKMLASSVTEYTGADFSAVGAELINGTVEKGMRTVSEIVTSVKPSLVYVAEVTPKDIYGALDSAGNIRTDLKVMYSKKTGVKSVWIGDKLLDRDDDKTVYRVANTFYGEESGVLRDAFLRYILELYSRY